MKYNVIEEITVLASFCDTSLVLYTNIEKVCIYAI